MLHAAIFWTTVVTAISLSRDQDRKDALGVVGSQGPTLLRTSRRCFSFSLVAREANCCSCSGVGGVVMSR